MHNDLRFNAFLSNIAHTDPGGLSRRDVSQSSSLFIPCAALILPASNTEAMNLHLLEIAKTVTPGAHAVLLVDQAGWHLSMRLVVPPNVTIIALPPKCP